MLKKIMPQLADEISWLEVDVGLKPLVVLWKMKEMMLALKFRHL
jgi:hypothetical protein